MGVESSISSKVLLRHVISVLTIISLENWVASVGLKDEFCKPAECGKDMIGHPFWSDTKLSTNRSFPTDCDDKPPLKLHPFGESLVDYDNQSLKLTSEFERTGNACFAPTPPPSESDTDDSDSEPPSFLNQRPSYLAFLHYCSSSPKVDHPYPYLTCHSVGANRTCVALVNQPKDPLLDLSAWASHVLVPVELSDGSIEEMKKGDHEKRWSHGFKVIWNLTSWDSCVKCKKSGGKCIIHDEGFLCACSGAAYPLTCTGNNYAALKIGVGSGVGALASIFLCSCIYMIHYKRRHPFLKLRSRQASSGSSLKADIEVGNVLFEVPIFTNGELEEATNYFDSARELGDGGYGTVYHGKLRDGREVAVKRLYEHNYRRVKQFMTEVQILTRLRHKYLVSLYGCTSQHSRELLLVYEYIPNGTVADHLHGKRAQQDPLLWPTRISIAIETATALAYLHASDIIHRDVKTNNILLDNNFSVKVADFGLSRLFPNDVSHVSTAPQGTPGYVDPEYHQCYQLTEKSDVYSFGVVLVELISSMPAVDISRDRHEINLANLATSKIQKHAFHELIDPNLGFESDPEINRMIMAVAELAFRCLQQDKDMRPSMETVLEELKAISSGTQEPDKSKDVSDDNSIGQSKNPPPSPESEGAGLLKNVKPSASPVSVTQKWGSSGSSTVQSG
ncbi:LEAF RUST 10 DISEASE-RESISTANCE LOCUS RECEPTOR-LIKE PROTEIN KINASE-like 1.1 isoform X2 [Rhodamnia argentea]|uniref:LEAF RUST 10 DISEASE-RESISTANCE LOCUS RECEPTOR-LIKE PROTEIN KINASE-like 1.1 isoform X2 n=1 Tax=Rhodamnia argentea TaxID=178133 RepID=A0ABM3HDK6_9MYRT|nr:LEAF RUST 10 DISEASE-RESISTANCE LOCUS RECEPTOR-LIKE PROTEIN KINASE-like 1.1 isoform X2 [Rhodamnia argentea]